MLHLLAAALTTAHATVTTTFNHVPLPPAGNSIFNPIAKPIADVLAAFYAVVPNYGVAIMALSVLWMVIIAPLTLKSTRSMLAMQKLQPELKKLQAEYKNDRQAFAQAQMDLFKTHNVSPFGSCLPTLLPLPVFFALFKVIDGLSATFKYHGHTYANPNFLSPHTAMYKAIVKAGGHINAFGLDLSKNALSGHSSFLTAAPYFILLLIMIGTQYAQTAQMMSRNKAAANNPQMKVMKYLPIIFGVILIRFPAGVILYYAVSNLCRMGQQTAMYRWDPKVKVLATQDLREMTDEIKDLKASRSKAAGDDPAPGARSRFKELLANSVEAQSRPDKTKPSTGPATKARPPAPAGTSARPVKPPQLTKPAKPAKPPQPAPPARANNNGPANGNGNGNGVPGTPRSGARTGAGAGRSSGPPGERTDQTNGRNGRKRRG